VSWILLCTIIQIACYQLCALPSIVRIVKRKSSGDLSIWREVLILCGAGFQMTAMALAHVKPIIFASPITSVVSVTTVLIIILKYRRAS